ncbi:MAG: DNA polymerase III subunit [Planctomycetota bacterium]
MSFEEVLGQEKIIKRFESAIAGGRLAHGFIFAGPRGCGKTTLALALARRLLCDGSAAAGCGCRQCAKLRLDAEGQVSHGDVYILAPHVQTIRVEDIRNELIDRVQLRPVEGKYKVFIMQEAERMAPAASNAFLKTLEEPPTDTIIILESRRPELFLDTIRSRCQTVWLSPLPEERFIDALKEREPDLRVRDARILFSFTEGSLGEAIRLTEDDWLPRAEEFINLLNSGNEIDPFDFAEQAAKKTSGTNLESQRREILILLDFAVERLRNDLTELPSSDERSTPARLRDTESAINRLYSAKEQIRANMRVESVLERLKRDFAGRVLLRTGKG